MTLTSVLTAAPQDYALKFDGKDDLVDLCMAPFLKQWTVSAWVNKEGRDWSWENFIISSLTGIQELEVTPTLY